MNERGKAVLAHDRKRECNRGEKNGSQLGPKPLRQIKHNEPDEEPLRTNRDCT
jgi:hypothetical protein